MNTLLTKSAKLVVATLLGLALILTPLAMASPASAAVSKDKIVTSQKDIFKGGKFNYALLAHAKPLIIKVPAAKKSATIKKVSKAKVQAKAPSTKSQIVPSQLGKNGKIDRTKIPQAKMLVIKWPR